MRLDNNRYTRAGMFFILIATVALLGGLFATPIAPVLASSCTGYYQANSECYNPDGSCSGGNCPYLKITYAILLNPLQFQKWNEQLIYRPWNDPPAPIGCPGFCN